MPSCYPASPRGSVRLGTCFFGRRAERSRRRGLPFPHGRVRPYSCSLAGKPANGGVHGDVPVERLQPSRQEHGEAAPLPFAVPAPRLRSDRKSTRLNSSHVEISYAVFCLKKKKKKKNKTTELKQINKN